MTNLFLDRILEFYGVPQILVAKDSFGTQYLCLLFDDGAGCYTIKVPSCDKNIFQDIARRMGWVCM